MATPPHGCAAVGAHSGLALALVQQPTPQLTKRASPVAVVARYMLSGRSTTVLVFVVFLGIVWTLLAVQLWTPISLSSAYPLAAISLGFSSSHSDVVIYVYAHSAIANENFAFFLRHGLHDAADFIFVFNGDDGGVAEQVPQQPNIRIVKRENTCFDLGTHGVILKDPDVLRKQYQRFILMNASVKGPFIPHWSHDCWSSLFWSPLNDKTKIVGTTVNTQLGHVHLQSMVLALDRKGIELVLPLLLCFETKGEAIQQAEVLLAERIVNEAYSYDALSIAYQAKKEEYTPDSIQDPWYEGGYFDINVDPFEVIFPKNNRGVNSNVIDRYSSWIDSIGYSSYEVCRKN